MPVDDAIASPSSTDRPTAPGKDAPLAIQVEGLHKSFRIPTHRVDSLKERAVRPFSSREYRELHALDGVSFEIRKGEFFGIVGRNGPRNTTPPHLPAPTHRPHPAPPPPARPPPPLPAPPPPFPPPPPPPH